MYNFKFDSTLLLLYYILYMTVCKNTEKRGRKKMNRRVVQLGCVDPLLGFVAVPFYSNSRRAHHLYEIVD